MGLKKGFFFSALALVILSLMALSLFLWSEQTSIQYSLESEKFKINSMQSPFLFISESNLNKFANISAIYAVNKLADALISHPEKIKGISFSYSSPKPTPNKKIGDEYGIYYVNSSIFELMFSGSTSGHLIDEFGSLQKYFYKIQQQNLSYLPEEKVYTLSNYFDQTTSLAKNLGYDLEWGKPQEFSIKHEDYRTLRVVFYIPVKLSSKNFNIYKKIKVNTSFNIDGLPDPYLAIRYRQALPFSYFDDGSLNPPQGGFTPIDYGPKPVPYKNVYFSQSYKDANAAQAKLITTGSQGLGWFYGPVVIDPIDHTKFFPNDPLYNLSKINEYIFATSNVSKAREESRFFGAIILYGVKPYYKTTFTDPLILEEENCIWCIKKQSSINSFSTIFYKYPTKRDIPFIITSSQIPILLNSVKKNTRSGLPEVLINSNLDISDICSDFSSSPPQCSGVSLTHKDYSYSKASIYNLNGPRDMALCGFYIPSDYGPSYLQRFTNFDYTDFSKDQPVSDFGIESFDVGAWAGGFFASSPDPLYTLSKRAEYGSRIDYHFLLTDQGRFSLCQGVFIKGMPGCKNNLMCSSNDPALNGVGRFSLTNKTSNPTFRYNLYNFTILYGPTTNRDCR